LAGKAAVKAMLVNRIGDLALLIGISVLYFSFFSLKYTVIYSIVLYYLNFIYIILGYSCNLLTIICLFLFFGAMGKSAQLGLHM